MFIPAKREDVFRYCASLTGFQQQFPFTVKWLSGPEQWQHNDMLEFKYRLAGIWIPHFAKIIDFKQNEFFVDRMTRGLYKDFQHTHSFITAANGTWVEDEVEFSFGFGSWIDKLIGVPTLRSAFTKRHTALVSYFEKRCK